MNERKSRKLRKRLHLFSAHKYYYRYLNYCDKIVVNIYISIQVSSLSFLFYFLPHLYDFCQFFFSHTFLSIVSLLFIYPYSIFSFSFFPLSFFLLFLMTYFTVICHIFPSSLHTLVILKNATQIFLFIFLIRLRLLSTFNKLLITDCNSFKIIS